MDALGKSLERKVESGISCLNHNRRLRTRRCAIIFLQGCNLIVVPRLIVSETNVPGILYSPDQWDT
jgi:hypothetical protein